MMKDKLLFCALVALISAQDVPKETVCRKSGMMFHIFHRDTPINWTTPRRNVGAVLRDQKGNTRFFFDDFCETGCIQERSSGTGAEGKVVNEKNCGPLDAIFKRNLDIPDRLVKTEKQVLDPLIANRTQGYFDDGYGGLENLLFRSRFDYVVNHPPVNIMCFQKYVVLTYLKVDDEVPNDERIVEIMLPPSLIFPKTSFLDAISAINSSENIFPPTPTAYVKFNLITPEADALLSGGCYTYGDKQTVCERDGGCDSTASCLPNEEYKGFDNWLDIIQLDGPSKECVCPTGYELKDSQCVDIDECATKTDDCDINLTNCINTKGGFECSCPNGYTLKDSNCVDFDECANNTYNNCEKGLFTCVNTVGGYDCVCRDGYTLKGNGCVDIDECATDTHNCDKAFTSCINTEGGYMCIKKPGVTCPTESECVCNDGSYQASLRVSLREHLLLTKDLYRNMKGIMQSVRNRHRQSLAAQHVQRIDALLNEPSVNRVRRNAYPPGPNGRKKRSIEDSALEDIGVHLSKRGLLNDHTFVPPRFRKSVGAPKRADQFVLP